MMIIAGLQQKCQRNLDSECHEEVVSHCICFSRLFKLLRMTYLKIYGISTQWYFPLNVFRYLLTVYL